MKQKTAASDASLKIVYIVMPTSKMLKSRSSKYRKQERDQNQDERRNRRLEASGFLN